MLFRKFSTFNSSVNQLQLNNTLRKLWSDHIFWTRLFINSTVFGTGDLEFVTNRLLQNPVDFAKALSPYYGEQNANEFQKLLTDHLTIAAQLVNAAKDGDTNAVGILEKEWYKNASDIAEFLGRINPFWDTSLWKQMLDEHLKLTENEAVQVLNGEYKQSITTFDMIYNQALKMADEMTRGISKQFKI